MATQRFTDATTIDQVIRSAPPLNRVLSAHGIDTCCGAQCTLAEAAQTRGIVLGVLLQELNAALPPEAAATSGPAALPAPARYLRFFFASLLFALTFGSALGACMLATITLPWNFVHGLPLAAVKTAHGYAQVYGFATLFIMGVAYHVVPRFKGVALVMPGCTGPSFWLQVGGVLVVALGMLAGPPVAPRAWLAGSAALLCAALLFAWNISATLAAGQRTAERFEPFLRAGCLWLVAATTLELTAAASGRTSFQPVVWELALWGFTGSWLFGMSLRILPVFLGVAAVGGSTSRKLFIGYQTAVAAWSVVALMETWHLLPAARAIAGAALVVSVVALVLQLGVLGPRERGAADAGGYAKFIVAAYGWVLVAVLFAPGWSVGAALAGGGAPALLLDFGRHAFTLGFLTQMIVGVATRIVPVFTGAPLWSRTTRDTTFWLLNAAVVTRGLQVMVELAGSEEVWPYISLSGLFGFAAFVAFALNVFMTIRSRPAAPARAQAESARHNPSADHVIADLLQIPGALELLVARGFRPLSNPALRALMAGTLTLRQACRLHNIDAEPLVAELRRLAGAQQAA
jgi:Domain of unknown function (DUF1858)/NnrS protein/Domain of Unknown function (DUF542)